MCAKGEFYEPLSWIHPIVIAFSLFLTMGDALATSLPGTPPFDKALLAKFEAMKHKRGKDYKPRTRHLNPDGSPKFTNRLFLESSPYLLQHAHNPVNWYPWGDEAFNKAKELKRPVLS